VKEQPTKTDVQRSGPSPRTSGGLHASWEGVGAVVEMVSKILIPIVLGVIGLALNSALKEKDVGVKMVELAVGILRVDPATTDVRQATELRDWAIRVIEHYSEVPLKGAASELRTRPLQTVLVSQGLMFKAEFRTVNAAGRMVQGLQVLCAPRGSRDRPEVMGSGSPVVAPLWRGLYECWARDPKSNREGSHLKVDLFEAEEASAISLPAPG